MSRKNRVELICHACGKPYEVEKARAQKSKYCSISCCHVSKQKPAPKAVQICKICHKPFDGVSWAMYCSQACAQIAAENVELICKTCGKPYFVEPYRAGKSHYCSKECLYSRPNTSAVTLVCPTCGKQFERHKGRAMVREINYCSHACWAMVAGKTKVMRKCKNCGKSFNIFSCRLKDGKGFYCSRKCTDEAKRDENNQGRKSWRYRPWRDAVYKRDNYTCQTCHKKSGKIVAHHIKAFARYPAERFSVDNGITLCESCHIALHKHLQKPSISSQLTLDLP